MGVLRDVRFYCGHPFWHDTGQKGDGTTCGMIGTYDDTRLILSAAGREMRSKDHGESKSENECHAHS